MHIFEMKIVLLSISGSLRLELKNMRDKAFEHCENNPINADEHMDSDK
jgi:hypothetical protein